MSIMMFERQCPECGTINHFQQSQALFCPNMGNGSPSCKRAWNNRALGQAAPLLPYLKAWRKSRHAAKGDPIGRIVLNELCLSLDRMIAEDAAAGRMNPIEYIKQRYRMQGLGGMLQFEAPASKPAKPALKVAA